MVLDTGRQGIWIAAIVREDRRWDLKMTGT